MTTVTKPKTMFTVPAVRGASTLIVQPSPPTKTNSSIKFELENLEGPQIVLFGSERQRELSQKLDDLLVLVTKGSSPVLFEMFRQLQKGIDEANLPELEKSVREALQKRWYHSILDVLHLSNRIDRMQKASSRVENMVISKSKSLLDLTRKMEDSTETEVAKLVSDISKLSALAIEYRKDLEVLQEYVDSGNQILAISKARLENMRNTVDRNDQLSVENLERYEQKVELFENRVLTLEHAVGSAMKELQAIRLSQGAAFSTLGETANASMQDFNEIKAALIKQSVNMQLQQVQQMGKERRVLKNKLQSYESQTLDNVAINAKQSMGLNRLEDANNLLENAKKLKALSDRLIAEERENQKRYSEARQKLEESKKHFLSK